MSSNNNNKKQIIVALDFPNEKSCLQLVDQLDPSLCRVKIGKELFTRCGPALVTKIVNQGFDLFLDLKFHDIPNTVAKAVSVAADLGVWMVNVHASGGKQMMLAARQSLTAKDAPLLIGVTVLTSMDALELNRVGVFVDPGEQVLNLAKLTLDCGLDGVVCSSQETLMLRNAMPKKFCLVTPGIRPKGDDQGDQKRIATPASAIDQGSDFLVIGRPITQADDPIQKLMSILKEIESKN